MYYEVLGLTQGATQAEVKKAYFSLVRQHSPEKDPEKFREIREAYEHLKNAQEEQGPVFALPKDPWAKKFLQQIQSYQKVCDDEIVRDACEEAWRIFPDEIQFLYLLTKAQRRAGNTGKAVKSGEELVKKEPENKWFWRELAISYQERGYTRKAFCAFDRAYELGCRDNDFLLDFSLSCEGYGQYDKGIRVLTELVGKERRWQKEEITQIIEAYSGLISMSIQNSEDSIPYLERFKDFLQQYTIYLEENMDMLVHIVGFLAIHPKLDRKSRPEFQEIIDILKGACRSDEVRELTDDLWTKSQKKWVHMDPRLSETMKSGVDACFMMHGMETELRTFAMLDVKLCMIEERQELLPQLDLIEDEYPEYFDKIRDFAQQLRDGKNLEYLKSSMLKQYSRMAQYMGGGMYFEKYPHEKTRRMGTVIYESGYDAPYVRSEKKIGRNDPCPCGSGKKYKHCCMRKK